MDGTNIVGNGELKHYFHFSTPATYGSEVINSGGAQDTRIRGFRPRYLLALCNRGLLRRRYRSGTALLRCREHPISQILHTYIH
jgi:hypothetical protein